AQRSDHAPPDDMTSLRATILLLCVASGAIANTAELETYRGNGFTVLVPKRWTVRYDATTSTLVAVQDPSRSDAAVLMLVARRNTAGATEDQVLDQLAATLGGLTVTERAAFPNGRGHAMLAEGEKPSGRMRAGAVTLVDHDVAFVGV